MIGEILVTGIVLGGAYWVYKCKQKEDCSVTGECNTVIENKPRSYTELSIYVPL